MTGLNTLAREPKNKRVAITGGAGYVGSALVPRLLALGHEVTVLDTFWFNDTLPRHENLRKLKGDIRNKKDLREAFVGQDAVIHLACISNDPSFEMSPKLGKSINYDCFGDILDTLKTCSVKRFIYASSSSVYGISESSNVTERSPCDPLTDYSKFKLLCENDLKFAKLKDTEWVIVRPATVCGYAPRLRLDLTINILTIHALVKKLITVYGGKQLRPNINIKDMVRAYEVLLHAPEPSINGQTFNIGFHNKSVAQLAKIVKKAVADDSVEIVTETTTDHRSYQVNSDKIYRALAFTPKFPLEEAVGSIVMAYAQGKIDRPLINTIYSNIKRMHELGVSL